MDDGRSEASTNLLELTTRLGEVGRSTSHDDWPKHLPNSDIRHDDGDFRRRLEIAMLRWLVRWLVMAAWRW